MTSALRRLRFSAFAALLGLAVSLSPALAQLGPGGGGGGGGGGGTSSSFSTTFPSIGTAIGASDGTNMKPLLVDGSGYLEVNIKAGAGSGGTALADEAAFTQGTTDITPIGCLYITSYSALSTGQAGVMQCDSAGRPKVVGAGTAGTATGGVLTVQGVASMTPVQVSQATAASLNATVVGTGTFAVQATLQASATTAIGKVDPNTIATWGLATLGGATAPTNAQSVAGEYLSSAPTYTNGQAGALQMTAAGSLHTTVDNTNANGSAVSASSSPVVIASDQAAVAVKAASAAFASGSLASGAVVDLTNITGTKAAGTAAADSVLGGVVYNSTLPAPTNGQQTAAQADNQGRAIAAPGSILSHTLVKGTTAAMTGTTSTQLIALVSSQRIYPTHISCNNSSSTATLVSIQDGSAGTTLMTLIAPAGGGDTESDIDALTWTTAGNGLYAADVTTGASVICSASGHSSAN